MTNRYAQARHMTGQTHHAPPMRLYTPPTKTSSLPLTPPPLTIHPSQPQPMGDKTDRTMTPRPPSKLPAKSGILDDPDRIFLFLLIGLLLLNDAAPELILALCYLAM